MKQNVTIRDVARYAGVSHQTVSRVINNKSEISAKTRQKVLDAMTTLNYRPSRIAQSMNTSRTYTVGLLVPNIANPFFSNLVTGAQHYAEMRNYNIFLCHTEWQPEKEERFLESLADHQVDGLIINGSRTNEESLLNFAQQCSPIVLGGRKLTGPRISRVGWDNDYGGQVIADYLVQQGHRRVGILAGPPTESTMSNWLRLDAIIKALESVSIAPAPQWIVNGTMDAEGGYTAARTLLTANPDLSAIVAHNDLMAIGAMHACRELGIRVPQDCAVIGYNDIELAAMVNPPLTTVRINRYSLGQAMMQRLLQMIEAPEEDFPPLLIKDGELIQRESA